MSDSVASLLTIGLFCVILLGLFYFAYKWQKSESDKKTSDIKLENDAIEKLVNGEPLEQLVNLNNADEAKRSGSSEGN